MKRFAVVFGSLAAAVAALAGGAMAAAARNDAPGVVYTLTNSPAGNAVAVFDRAADGSLAPAGTYPTAGLGTGGGLGTQGALVITDNGRYVLAVNPGSDSIAAFRASGDELELLGAVPSGGNRPVSLAVHGRLVYTLNAGSAAISGFVLDAGGLHALAGSTRSLAGSGPAQVGFSPRGDVLVVTEKTTNTIDTFAVGDDGVAGAARSFASNGGVPFGFDWDVHGDLVVADANAGPGESAASSYAVSRDGTLTPISGPVPTHQAAACWLVTTKDGGFAFTANAGSGSISTFAVGPDGALTLAGTTAVGTGSHPLDEAVSENGRFLYVLVDGRHSLAGFRIGADGSLSPVAEAAGLPVGAAGIAAR
jgi:6-phosphogluconolactonase